MTEAVDLRKAERKQIEKLIETKTREVEVGVDVWLNRSEGEIELSSVINEVDELTELSETAKDWLRCEIVRRVTAQVEAALDSSLRSWLEDIKDEGHRAGPRELLLIGNEYFATRAIYWTGSEYVATGEWYGAKRSTEYEARGDTISEAADAARTVAEAIDRRRRQPCPNPPWATMIGHLRLGLVG